MYSYDFDKLSRHTILDIESVEVKENSVTAIITSSTFKRVTTKPWSFSKEDWVKIYRRGYI